MKARFLDKLNNEFFKTIFLLTPALVVTSTLPSVSLGKMKSIVTKALPKIQEYSDMTQMVCPSSEERYEIIGIQKF